MKSLPRLIEKVTVVFFLLLSLAASSQKQSPGKSNISDRLRLADEIEKSIQTEMLNKWYPRNVDTIYGGFLSTFTYNFQPTGPQDKMIVTQARHVWSNAIASQLYPAIKHYKECGKHGFAFLQNTMWDKTNGGFFTLVDRKGKVKDSTGKVTYGNAFGIYASAAWYKASGDINALNLAKNCFAWLEKHCHDPIHKGYFQDLLPNGTPVARTADIPSTSTIGYKDQNSSIHLLEAFTELYPLWPDPLLRERLQEMLVLIRDVITTKEGYLALFLQPDWTPVSFKDSSESVILKHRNLDHVSFGHDVETAYLLLEASHALGLKNDTTTMIVAKRMVDHALRNGWDNKTGGFYDEGYYFSNRKDISIIKNSKNWWAQAEGLNTLLLMADLFPNDPMHYFEKFKLMWRYIQVYLIDHEHGEWYQEGLDTRPESKTALKGHIWKGNYHQLRSLSNCVQRLRTSKQSQDTSAKHSN